MPKLNRLMALAGLLPLLAACGSIVHGNSQAIQVTTVGLPPGVTAACELQNGRTAWLVSVTPGVVSVDRSRTPLKTVCRTVTGWYGETVVQSMPSEYSLGGNLASGAVAGTGAGYGVAAATSSVAAGVATGVAVGGVGAAYDLSSGAAWRYPDYIQVSMTPGPYALTPIAPAVASPLAPMAVPVAAEPQVRHRAMRPRHRAQAAIGLGRPTK